MTAVTVTEAIGKFREALDDRRRQHVQAFQSWLKGALANAPDEAGRQTIADRILQSRRKVLEDFINSDAPPLVEALNPGAKQNVIRQLREFAALAEFPQAADVVWPDARPSGVLPALLGAPLGAASGLLLLAAVTYDFDRDSARPAQEVARSQPAQSRQPPAAPVTVTAPAENGAPPQGGDGSPSAPAKIAPTPASPRIGPARASEPLGLSIIIGALGAGLGALLATVPFARRPTRTQWRPAWLGPFGPTGATAIGTLLLGAAGLAGLLFAGLGPVSTALLALAAAAAILMVRRIRPAGAGNGEFKHQTAVWALDHHLLADAAIWSAVASGLTVGQQEIGGAAKLINDIKSVVLAHRDQREPGEDILQIVEQELGLPIGPRDTTAKPATQSDFVWTPQHAQQYEAFGLVEPGDVVRVRMPPRTTTAPNGTTTVLQKGVVVRKS